MSSGLPKRHQRSPSSTRLYEPIPAAYSPVIFSRRSGYRAPSTLIFAASSANPQCAIFALCARPTPRRSSRSIRSPALRSICGDTSKENPPTRLRAFASTLEMFLPRKGGTSSVKTPASKSQTSNPPVSICGNAEFRMENAAKNAQMRTRHRGRPARSLPLGKDCRP